MPELSRSRGRSNARPAPTPGDAGWEGGLLQSLLVPLHGESLGWMLLYGMVGLWLLFATSTFGSVFFGWPVVWITIAITYASFGRFFDACMRGAREGRLEPRETGELDRSELRDWVLNGMMVLLPLMLLLGVCDVLLFWVGWTPWTSPGGFSPAYFAVSALFLLPYPAMLALWRSTGSPMAILSLPHHVLLMRAAGWRYLVPTLIINFAALLPWYALEQARAGGAISGLIYWVLWTVLAGYAFGATGAAMGWIAAHNEDVRDLLDGAAGNR